MVPVVPIQNAEKIFGSDGMGGQPEFPPAASPELLTHLQVGGMQTRFYQKKKIEI